MATSAVSGSAQEYFWFDDGGTITPAEGTVDEIDKIVIDYSGCAGTDEGLNIGTGKGTNWITSNSGNYSVTLADDYTNHKLTLTVANGPIVKAGDYKLTIPEGAMNVYGNASLINDAVSYYWTVSGVNDVETPVVKLVSSYPAADEVLQLPIDTLWLTFDQDVTVTHSTFDAAGRITNLTSGGFIQLNMKADGNVIWMTKGSYSSSEFYAGQQYQLDLYANHIKSAHDPSISLPETAITFSIAKADSTAGLMVMTQLPAAGENIHNAGSITFNKALTAVDKSKVTLVNEQGVVAELSSVGRDSESPRSLIFNIDPNAQLMGGTTYKLHLEAGAVWAGEETNEEMDAGYWCIPKGMFTFASDLENASVPEFGSMTLTAIDAKGLWLSGDSKNIKVTGVSANEDYVYAELADIAFEGQEQVDMLTLSFDKMITPELLAEGGALYNSVKVVIPQGTFCDDLGRENKQCEVIVYVVEEKEMGEQTWTFNPASGSTIESLGFRRSAEDEGGVTYYYEISFAVSGENVYAHIPDGSVISLVNVGDGSVTRTFNRYDVLGYNNQFTLSLGDEPVTADGVYKLTIPAEAIYLHSDAAFRTNAIHPDEDVVAVWTIGAEAGIECLKADTRTNGPIYDLMGRVVRDGHGWRLMGRAVSFH